ncbi:recombinase XerD [Natronolimnohabitans sp. A-GB9]|uniref:tyrosine-type recombinase/integrase n=1 Tax=Natronolimnohabitans sp. A-GB9 TaxID=3069757 RepID=UPI0027B5B40B|nr:recombinase XerD [Natronolimnohabitans sp. A-GB9]MDQ2052150.1 recombinase XerD [Natronolimnohabitans sp. A-GB9]
MSDSEAGSNGEITVVDAIDTYLQRKAVGNPDGTGAGTYASNAESILRRWADWLERDHGVSSLFALEVAHMRAYADELRARADRGEYTASTAGTYYAVVRAFLSWCVRGGILESNPAATDAAEATLPTAEERSNGDYWTTDQRRRLEDYVRTRALEAASVDDRDERISRLREYAMVALLAHSGVRGSELFRVPDDDRRTGATWDDVDFYTGTIRVLGKSQRLEEVAVLAPARTALRRYRVVLDPPANDWPLFPTRHAPSIARQVRETLRERGHDEEAVEELLESRTATELARERAIAPPAITTEGARSVLKRLCKEAGVDIDGDYLTPRGVRGDRTDEQTRQEASPSKPQLRSPPSERAIAVPRERPLVERLDSTTEPDDATDSE